MADDRTEMLAAGWLAREDRGLSGAERDEMAAWLAQSTLHRVAYLRLKANWQRADRLAVLKRPVPRGRPVHDGMAFARALRLAAAALLAVLAGGGLYFAYRVQPDPPRQANQFYVTNVGQLQTVQLDDGSRIELNTNTRVHTRVTQTQRTVTLDAGEAYFDIAHDTRRPFVVYAGNRRITDLGTKFSVYHNGEDVQVTVKEGHVRVDILNKAAAVAPVEAMSGSVVIAHTEETLVLARPDRQIADDLSWRKGILVFNQQTLAEAAEQFNRYNTRQIVVEGKARKIRIGGTFKADNVDGFMYLIHQGFGVSVSERGNSIIVSL